jgi:uncharacterized protein with HEPN domain
VSRDWRLYLDDIREACEKIERYTREMNQDAFVGDDRTFDAVLRNLEVIGEAAKSLPDNVKAQCPTIDWRKVVGLRDVIVHGYFGLEPSVLWDIVSKKLPELCSGLRRLPET